MDNENRIHKSLEYWIFLENSYFPLRRIFLKDIKLQKSEHQKNISSEIVLEAYDNLS